MGFNADQCNSEIHRSRDIAATSQDYRSQFKSSANYTIIQVNNIIQFTVTVHYAIDNFASPKVALLKFYCQDQLNCPMRGRETPLKSKTSSAKATIESTMFISRISDEPKQNL